MVPAEQQRRALILSGAMHEALSRDRQDGIGPRVNSTENLPGGCENPGTFLNLRSLAPLGFGVGPSPELGCFHEQPRSRLLRLRKNPRALDRVTGLLDEAFRTWRADGGGLPAGQKADVATANSFRIKPESRKDVVKASRKVRGVEPQGIEALKRILEKPA